MNDLSLTLPITWVVTDVMDDKRPYYDCELIKVSTINYLTNNLKHYVNHIRVGFYFFNSETDEESFYRYVSGVRISLNAKVPFSVDYYQALVFTLRSPT